MVFHKPAPETCRAVRCGTIKRYVGRHRTWSCDQVSCYTVKKGSRYSHSPAGIKLFPARESLVSDIPAGDGKIACLHVWTLLLTSQSDLSKANWSLDPLISLLGLLWPCKNVALVLYRGHFNLLVEKVLSNMRPLKIDAPFLEPKNWN